MRLGFFLGGSEAEVEEEEEVEGEEGERSRYETRDLLGLSVSTYRDNATKAESFESTEFLISHFPEVRT